MKKSRKLFSKNILNNLLRRLFAPKKLKT